MALPICAFTTHHSNYHVPLTPKHAVSSFGGLQYTNVFPYKVAGTLAMLYRWLLSTYLELFLHYTRLALVASLTTISPDIIFSRLIPVWEEVGEGRSGARGQGSRQGRGCRGWGVGWFISTTMNLFLKPLRK